MINTDWFAAFLIGFVGAGHCMGMCGGIASLLSLGQPHQSKWTPLLYNFGRIASYMLFGALIGGAFATIASLSSLNQGLVWLRIVAALFMIMLALYIGQWWQGLLKIEALGQALWRQISPFGQSLLPLKSPLHAVPFGFIWGWLPCGLVYSTLTWAAVSGSALNGLMIMLCFGLGTLPAMLLVGYGAPHFKQWQQAKWFRSLAATLLLIYAAFLLIESINMLN